MSLALRECDLEFVAGHGVSDEAVPIDDRVRQIRSQIAAPDRCSFEELAFDYRLPRKILCS